MVEAIWINVLPGDQREYLTGQHQLPNRAFAASTMGNEAEEQDVNYITRPTYKRNACETAEVARPSQRAKRPRC
jgi:hypothetical protein